jgi:hypothetical protein
MVAVVAAALAVLPGVEKVPQRAKVIVEALIADSGGHDHIVRVRNRVWTIQHPIDERFEVDPLMLFECRFVDLIQIAWGQGAFGEGYHRVWIDSGVLMWEDVTP